MTSKSVPYSPARKQLCEAEARAVLKDFRALNTSWLGSLDTDKVPGAVAAEAYVQCMANQRPRLIDSVRGQGK